MSSQNEARPTVAVIGGTGDLGKGLALRAAAAGYPVVIGSRSVERALAAAAEVAQITGSARLSGDDNAGAAQSAQMVILAVPYAAHADTLAQIKPHVGGKVVVDSTVPLKPPKVMRVQLPAEGTAAQQTRRTLGEDALVTAAFHSVAAAKLANLDQDIDCDILVFGDLAEAREQVVRLITDMNLKAWHAGPLDNAVIGEALTSTLIFINKRYRIAGAGIRITGEPAG